jgi:hypothetical protein
MACPDLDADALLAGKSSVPAHHRDATAAFPQNCLSNDWIMNHRQQV